MDPPPLPFEFRDAVARAVVDVKAYRLSAVQKAAYGVADRCTVILGELANDVLPLTFLFAPGVSETIAHAVVRLFFQDLLDQELREQLAEETRPIRALILAQAFSKTDLIRRQ
jgi:His-Xaa-Ser system protein HxsD